MLHWTIAFLLGVLTITLLTQLPGLGWAWGLLLSSLSLLGLLQWLRRRKTLDASFRWHDKFLCKCLLCLRLILFGLLGFSWALLRADITLAWTLPHELENKPITVIGTIASLPEQQTDGIRFEFDVESLQANNTVNEIPTRIRLSWYQTNASLHIGDKWQLTVRLKRPRGYWDPGSFDYQAWLFEKGIRALGYVDDKGENHFLGKDMLAASSDSIREQLADSINQSLTHYPLNGLIQALAVGVRDNITQPQWEVLRGTGTNHLFAIAGLHIGFVAGMIFWLTSFFWRRSSRLCLWIPAQQAAAFIALLSAIFYSAMAGFSLPTQRALIMFVVLLVATLLCKKIAVLTSLCLALIGVLILDPFAVLDDSFWLSFVAVVLIIFGVSNRIGAAPKWQQWTRIQWVLSIGLLPLGLLFFQQSSWVSFIANNIAIPWVGFIVLPLCVLGDLVWFVTPHFSSWLFILAEQALELVWHILNFLALQTWGQWYAAINNKWLLFSACIGVILLLAPRGFPARYLGIIWCLPLVFWQAPTPPTGAAWIALLDVGQGLSVIIRTQHHTLIYDTGPKLGPTFDTGSAVILPFLRMQGIRTIDMLMVSHGDNDHIGGAASILAQMPVKQILSSVPDLFKPHVATLCQAGQFWEWDGVRFQVLYPPNPPLFKDNDNSCVLRIDANNKSILLTGDIEKKSENYLLQQYSAQQLASTIIVAPHHGSKTSSTLPFVQAVHPQLVLFPTGYLNRYGFPDAEPIANYQSVGALSYDTAQVGFISFSKGTLMPETYWQCYRRFWDE